MITAINENNMVAYKKLFEKANAVLGNGSAIDDIESYFQHLQTLIEKNPQFSILPLDENFFEIDADARTIYVPEAFQKNGLSVQGDETAEIVWFKIDRYYDIMDFYKNTTPIVQWKRKGEDKVHYSNAWYIDIELDPGKLIFGWPIDFEITQQAGDIEFSVRFFKIKSETSELLYSFNTLSTTIAIKKSLDLNSSEIVNSDVINTRIKSRIFNSIEGNISFIVPQFVTANKSGYLDEELTKPFLNIDVNNVATDLVMNLDYSEESNTAEKVVRASAITTGATTYYYWKQDGQRIEKTDTTVNIPIYLKFDSNNKIINFDNTNLPIYSDEACANQITDINDITAIDGKNYAIVYVKANDYTQYTIKEPGTYYVQASSYDLTDGKNAQYAEGLISNQTRRIVVPAPEAPELLGFKKDNNSVNRVILQNNTVEPIATIKPNYIPFVAGKSNKLDFAWTAPNGTKIEEEDLKLENNSSLSLGNYSLIITNYLNGGSKQGERKEIRVTRVPSLTTSLSIDGVQTVAFDFGNSDFNAELRDCFDTITFELKERYVADDQGNTNSKTLASVTKGLNDNLSLSNNSITYIFDKMPEIDSTSKYYCTVKIKYDELSDSYSAQSADIAKE